VTVDILSVSNRVFLFTTVIFSLRCDNSILQNKLHSVLRRLFTKK